MFDYFSFPGTTKYSCLNIQSCSLEEVGATDILVMNIVNSRSAPEPAPGV